MRKIFILLLIPIIACAHKISIEEMSTKQKIQAADDLFAKKRYRQSQEIYEKITFESKGDTLVKKAQYQLANCYYNLKLYEDAIFEYEELLRLFPVSKYSEDIEFMIGMCRYKLSYPSYYDQEETIKAIEQLKYFLTIYPNSEKKAQVITILNQCRNKLLEKKYENAHIYYKMEYNNAALMYLNEIFDENTNEEIDKKALILAAKIYNKKRDWEALIKILETFNQKYPDHPYIKEIERYLSNKNG